MPRLAWQNRERLGSALFSYFDGPEPAGFNRGLVCADVRVARRQAEAALAER